MPFTCRFPSLSVRFGAMHPGPAERTADKRLGARVRHVPFFRWVLTLGIVLIGCSAGVHMTVPDFPELEQLDLTVVEEAPDGRCTVRWTDPFEHHEEEGSYLCDADRDRALKAPLYDPETGFGWDSGFVVAEGKDKGELYSLEEDGAGADARIDLSDTLIAFGLLATAIGLVGGNIRATARLGGVRPAVVRRAARLSKAAALVAEDHDRATEEVREAWAPLHGERVREELGRVPISRLPWVVRLRSGDLEKGGIRTVRDVLDAKECKLGRLLGGGRPRTDSAVAAARRIADDARDGVAVRFEANRYEPRTTALLVAVQVLVDAGPKARDVAEAGRALAARLEPLLDDAEAASGYAHMLGAGPRRRRRARAAVRRLRALLEEAERDGVTERFGQVSVDLLRGQDSDPTGLDAWVDFDTRPAEYYRVLADVTGRKLSSAT